MVRQTVSAGRRFPNAAAPHRAEDRKALIEWAVLGYYIRAYDIAYDSPSAFVENDQQLMSTAMQHGVETFGRPTMKESWNSFKSLWQDFGIKPVESPF